MILIVNVIVIPRPVKFKSIKPIIDKCLAESQLVLGPEASPDPIDRLVQFGRAVGAERQPFILHLLP